MIPLKSIVSPITVAFTPAIMQIIESNCKREWAELHRLDHPNEDASPHLPAEDWLSTREGRTHFNLYQTYYVPGGLKDLGLNLSLSDMNLMLSRLTAQRYNVQGKRKIFEVRVRSTTAYRKFRIWWINRWVSGLADLPFNDPCPFEKYSIPSPPESYIIIGKHFEEWTGYKLPPKVWDDIKEMEKERLAYLDKYPKAA